jgi:quercetin dioxygenase-like cupin family protein
MSIEAIVIQAGRGKSLSMRGSQTTYKAEGERPSGGPTVLEFVAAPGFNTGEHVHRRIEEIFYVVEGEFHVRAGDQMVRANPGDFILIPPGVPHGYANPSGNPAKMLVTISPAGVHDLYFEELAELLAKPGPPDLQAIAELRQRYDTEQVSPISF